MNFSSASLLLSQLCNCMRNQAHRHTIHPLHVAKGAPAAADWLAPAASANLLVVASFGYDHFLGLAAAAIAGSLALSAFLYAKAFAPDAALAVREDPSTTTTTTTSPQPSVTSSPFFRPLEPTSPPPHKDGGVSGNHLYDFFIGRELNPRLASFDLKVPSGEWGGGGGG